MECVCTRVLRLFRHTIELLYTRCSLSFFLSFSSSVYENYSYANYSIVRRLFLLSAVGGRLRMLRIRLIGSLVYENESMNFAWASNFLPSFEIIIYSSLPSDNHVCAREVTKKCADTFSCQSMCVLIYFASYYDRPINLFLPSFDFIVELK